MLHARSSRGGSASHPQWGRSRSSRRAGCCAGGTQHAPRAAWLAQPVRQRPRPAAAAAAAGSGEHLEGVAVLGGGLAGLSAAVALHKLGVPVVVLERAPALRQEGAALALWSNAWRGLDELGVSEGLRSSYLQLTRVELASSGGRLLRAFSFDECSTDAAAAGGANETRGVRRAHLLQALADQLPPGALRFGCRASSVGTSPQGRPTLQLEGGQTLSCEALIGADGANSVVARHLGLQPPTYSGYVAGVAQYQAGELPLPTDTIRQVWGAGVRAGMYPLTATELYWYVCFNAPEGAPRPPDSAARVAEALGAVSGWAWGVERAVAATDPSSISRGAIRDRWTAGSFGRGCVTVAGDAAHPMTPNLGQGGCTAIEDGLVLARALAPLLAARRGGSADPAAVSAALRAAEAERSRRCLPLTVRSWAFGAALQLPWPPVVAARDLFVERAFSPAHFLDHTAYQVPSLRVS